MSRYLVATALVWCSVVLSTLGQTFSGFEPSTSNPLTVIWGATPLNYSGQLLPLDFLNAQSFPTVGLPVESNCNGTYILLMVDPDALQGDIETQTGLHAIRGNYTCDSGHVTTLGNSTFLELDTESQFLASYIPPAPQAKNPVVTHRYTLLLFNQPDNYTLPDTLTYALPLDLSNVTNRLNFNVTEFVDTLGESIVAGTYFDVNSPLANLTTTPSATSTGGASSTSEASSSPTPENGARSAGLSGTSVGMAVVGCALSIAYITTGQ
ncbi:phosphatidylethanolamine-binding protein [Annulohypoxylon maeteangense]|uniref:phosphatidylethanolamine-binding protein n=1 Tax=Annulohypoxylon maeteangense TaxID=1927788 RepID=UPI002007749B|nr:phosphatidylethanolamine-binding protein [Annulohypoxylon maeteangense]KAI0883768.1 phosphatidylethanolamine-binding protein [Annulohypoxylon maeteangense]